MKQAANHESQLGVTLVEILVVIVIAAIMVSLAAPSFSDFINRTKQTSVASQLVGDLNRARSEAIKRNARVLVCVRNGAGTDCGAGTDWQNGWLVCADVDADGACDAATTDNPNPLVVRTAVDAVLTLTASVASIQFRPNGVSGSGAVTLDVGGVWPGAETKTINVAATGNVSRL